MKARAPIFQGQHTDYVATDLWHPSRLTRVLAGVRLDTGTEVVIKVSRRPSVFDRVESTFHDGFVDFFGEGAAHCLVEQEAFVLGRLDSPRVVSLLDYGLFDGLRFVVTEKIEGHTLRELAESPWPAATARRLTAELLRALEHLREQDVVHRDLRPENILVSSAASPSLTLIDFGVATACGHGVPGTVGDSRYRAPERSCSWLEGANHRSDLYSAGVILHELLSGSPLFPRRPRCRQAHLSTTVPSLAELRPDVPVSVRRVIHRLLSKRPNDRYSSAREALNDLRDEPATCAKQPIEHLPSDRKSTIAQLGLAHLVGEVEVARTLVHDLLAVSGQPNLEDLHDLAYALLVTSLPGHAVAVALHAQECHDGPDAQSVLRKVAGTLAVSWTREASAEIARLLCIACTQIALAHSCRGDDPSLFFSRAVEAGRAAVLRSPLECPPEVVLHLAIAECEVGDDAFGRQLRNSVSFAKLGSLPSPVRELGSSAIAGKAIALLVGGQTRLARELVRDLPAHALAPELRVSLSQLIANMPDRLDAAVPWGAEF